MNPSVIQPNNHQNHRNALALHIIISNPDAITKGVTQEDFGSGPLLHGKAYEPAT